MNKTKIDWCTHTLNPVVGCTFNCQYCYARKMNTRFGWIPKWNDPQFFSERLKMLESKTPKIIFMNSVSDIADWKKEWLAEVFKSMFFNPQHTYLFLTKRLKSFHDNAINTGNYPNNIYIGVSINTQAQMDKHIREHCHADFFSIEPIMEQINITTEDLYWVIIGAETGNRKGKVIPKREWIELIVKQCRESNIPVFMKSSLDEIWGDKLIQEYPWEVTP